MAREITAGVLLKLKDQFSSKIQGAGISVQGFADKAVGVANKVNQAFSGVAGTLGTLGVSIGALSAIKSTIDLDNRLTRLGLTANASAQEVNSLKRLIFETAQMPDIKLGTDSVISGLEVVMTKVGDLQFVEDNVRNIALAIQASGESGDAMGAVFAEFAKFGYTAEEILPLMDDLIAQGDQGAFTFGEFAKNAPAVFSAYSAIGTSPPHIRKANAAMQILMAGTKSADIAVTALNSAMAELSDPENQKKLRMLGIAVRDSSGNFRDFNDIMFDIVARGESMGNVNFFCTIFGTTSMQTIRAYMTQGERMYDSPVNLGDTTGLLQKNRRLWTIPLNQILKICEPFLNPLPIKDLQSHFNLQAC
jgi:TP901 family phage tail tape measure protein